MKKTTEEKDVRTPLIAISGPMAAGKSTLAREYSPERGPS